jgi:2-(1,2-epoxy-1,2-dihydrophenyl)acetyl-CoA isomerase
VGESIAVSVEDGVVALRLSSPERRNVLDLELTIVLAEALEAASGAGAVALLAEGDHFCVGGDVRAFGGADDPREFVGGLAQAFHRVVRAVRAAPPVVVGARGWAAGAGMSLVVACDVVVAGESASFQPGYPGIGVTPDGGLSWTLPHAVGSRRARAILLQNEVLTAARAYELGLVDHVVTDAAVDAEALAIARRLARGPRAALAGVKTLVQAAAHDTLDEHLDAEAESIAAHAASADGQEGIHAFLERREPRFAAGD